MLAGVDRAEGGQARAATFGHAVWSEWTKIRTNRAAVWTALVAVGLALLFGAVSSRAAGLRYPSLGAADRAAFDGARAALQGCLVAQFAFGCLGARIVTAEYATGMIRTSLTAVPRRGRLLAAKAVVCWAVALAAGETAALLSFLTGQCLIEDLGAPPAALGEPGTVRALAGAGLYLALVGLGGLALGFLLRTAVGAWWALCLAVLLIPVLGTLLPGPLDDLLRRYWPTSAAVQIMSAEPDPGALPPWTGIGLLALTVAAALAAALSALRRREA